MKKYVNIEIGGCVKALMINTHKVMGENIYKYIATKDIYLIKKRFIWGNIKPDCTPKYKKIRHYYDESIDIIIDKILYLSSLSIDDVYNNIGIGKFSEEIGVVCHFLCDFFTAPHYYRWECKSTKLAKEHMFYEKDLGKIAKGYKHTVKIDTSLKSEDIRKFITNLQEEYGGKIKYEYDLYYSYYACESVVNMIFKSILTKKHKSNVAL